VCTSVDTGLGEMMKKNLNGKSGLAVKNDSVRHRLDTLDTASANLASSQLKQLTSMFCIYKCYLLVR